MKYQVRLTEQAQTDLTNLPVHLQEFLGKRLLELSESPSQKSRPSVSPPFPPNFMLYEIDYAVASERWHFSVLFRYHQDEMTLIVNAIGALRR